MLIKERYFLFLGTIAAMIIAGCPFRLNNPDVVADESHHEVIEKLHRVLNIGEITKSEKAVVPPYILDIYKSYSKALASETGTGINIRSFLSEGDTDEDEYTYILNIPREEEIVGAELHYYIPQVPHNTLKIQVFELQDSEPPEPLEERIIDSSRFGWIMFDVKSTVKKGFSSPIQNIVFKITVLDPFGQEVSSVRAMQDINKPVLIILSRNPEVSNAGSQFESAVAGTTSTRDDPVDDENTRSARKTRSAQPQAEDCRVHNFTISFQELGWPFVLHPESFNAGSCVGTCGKSSSSLSSEMLRKAYELGKVPEAYPPPCFPTETLPLTVYLEDDGAIRTVQLPGMIVTKCGCNRF